MPNLDTQVRERVSKSKHLQLVSGTNSRIYWLAAYIWDVVVYTCVLFACMLIFVAYDEPSFIGSAEQVSLPPSRTLPPLPSPFHSLRVASPFYFPSICAHPRSPARTCQASAIFLVLFLYGLSVLPLIYCYSFLFDSPTTAQVTPFPSLPPPCVAPVSPDPAHCDCALRMLPSPPSRPPHHVHHALLDVPTISIRSRSSSSTFSPHLAWSSPTRSCRSSRTPKTSTPS